MKQESLEIALIRYNKKTWCKSALLGFFIGLAVIVPGISGSTVAIIFKLYDQFLYAVGNLFRQFKKCFFFLLPIGIGILIGLLLGFIAVEKLLAILPFAVVGLFAGLMCGAFPAVKDELKGAKMNGRRIALLVLGVLIPIAIGIVSVGLNASGSDGTNAFATVRWWQVLVCIPAVMSSGLRRSCRGFPPLQSCLRLAGSARSWTASAWISGNPNPGFFSCTSRWASDSCWESLRFPDC